MEPTKREHLLPVGVCIAPGLAPSDCRQLTGHCQFPETVGRASAGRLASVSRHPYAFHSRQLTRTCHDHLENGRK